MSEYVDDACWRENYRDLVAGIRLIREAAEEVLGPLASLPNAERTSSSIEDCERIAQAIAVYGEKTKRHISKLEEQILLTSKTNIEGVTKTDEAQPIISD
jgi:hypothetical protein